MNITKRYEHDNKTGSNHEGSLPNLPVKRLTSSSITGDRVENRKGDQLGTIDTLMINIETGTVEYIVLKFGSFLGMGGKLFAIPFKALKLDAVREIFILNKEKEYLEKMPGFDQAHWPDTNEHTYFNDVDAYWGSSTTMI